MATNNAINAPFPIVSTQGGTGLNNSTATAHGILVAEGVNAFTPIVLGAGQVLVGTTASDPFPTTITGGNGITVSATSGAIQISAAGAGFTWATSGSATLVAENGYVVTQSAQAAFTLPATSVLGDQFIVMSSTGNTGFIQVVTTGSQTIRLGNVNATTSLTGTAIGDALHIVCVVAGTTTAGFQVMSSVGNFLTA